MNEIQEPADKPVVSEIPEWLQREVAAYDLDLADPPEVILDIGANIGAYTLRCAQRWPGAEIHAYEPVQENADGFRTHCADLFNVHFHQEAVRRFNGQDVILVGDDTVTHGFYQRGRQTVPGKYVECISAADLPEADLIKIDTEGCEVEILQKLPLGRARAIVCEWHQPEDRKAIEDICIAQGFKLHLEEKHSEANGLLKFVRPGAIKQQAVKLFIGLPVYAQMATQFNNCLLALQAQKPCEIELHTGQGDGVARTRNALTADFLKSDCTHLLMIDCDLIFAPHHVARIVSHNVDVVGGFYPKKQEGPLEWVINTYPGPVSKRSDGLHKVAYIGTGFLCIRRRVFEKMIEAYPWIAFAADYGTREIQHEFWPMAPYCAECATGTSKWCTHSPFSRRYLSEDWYFCQRWMDLGGEVFGDTGVPLKHIGPAIYPLHTQLPEMANPKTPEPEKLPASDKAEPLTQTALANEKV